MMLPRERIQSALAYLGIGGISWRRLLSLCSDVRQVGILKPRGQNTHTGTVEFLGTKRVRESGCPQVTVSVMEMRPSSRRKTHAPKSIAAAQVVRISTPDGWRHRAKYQVE